MSTSNGRLRRWLNGALLAALPLALAAGPAEAVEVGQTAPAFSLEAQDGTTRSPEGLGEETQAVLIFFRGLW